MRIIFKVPEDIEINGDLTEKIEVVAKARCLVDFKLGQIIIDIDPFCDELGRPQRGITVDTRRERKIIDELTMLNLTHLETVLDAREKLALVVSILCL